MKIGIIGTGHIGSTVANLFVKSGSGKHQIAISNSRGSESIKDLAKSRGTNNVIATTPEEAVKIGEVIVLAIPWRKRQELPESKLFEDKIVIDAMNPYSENLEIINLGDNTSSSEEVAKQIPKARLVKAFNTIYYQNLANGGLQPTSPLEDRLVIFIAGDDNKAKDVVSKLIEEIGFTPLDTGSLREGGKKQQPGSSIYTNPIKLDEARELLSKMR